MDAVGTVVDPGPTCLNELAGRDHRGMANERDEIALAAGVDTQNAEAVLGVVERDRSTSPANSSAGVGVLVLGASGIRV